MMFKIGDKVKAISKSNGRPYKTCNIYGKSGYVIDIKYVEGGNRIIVSIRKDDVGGDYFAENDLILCDENDYINKLFNDVFNNI